MRHIGGLGGRNCVFAIGRDRHAFGFNPHANLGHHLARLRIDNRGDRVVFIGDVEVTVIRVEDKLLGVFT